MINLKAAMTCSGRKEKGSDIHLGGENQRRMLGRESRSRIKEKITQVHMQE